MWNREDLAWCGGLFEGEGCISTTAKTLSLYLNMTDEDSVRRFHKNINIGKVHIRDSDVKEYKRQWVWSCHGDQDPQAVLAMLWPWLGKRRKEKTKELLSILSTHKAKWPSNRNKFNTKTHCPNGHKWEDDSFWLRSNKKRICKICNNRSKKLRKEVNKTTQTIEMER